MSEAAPDKADVQHERSAPGDTLKSPTNTGLPPAEEEDKPSALMSLPSIKRVICSGSPVGIFLDYDGTLTPIVSDPTAAVMSPSMRQVVHRLSNRFATAIVTGRSVQTITAFTELNDIWYAGSHGFDIRAPQLKPRKTVADEHLPALQAFRDDVRAKVKNIDGASVEDNHFSISVHYRNVADRDREKVEKIVTDSLSPHTSLKLAKGKMLHEVRPDIDWHKGAAVEYLLTQMFPDIDPASVCAVYIGDDWTDEDAFKALAKSTHSITIFVRPSGSERPTAAKYVLESPADVEQFLTKIAEA